MHRVLVIAHQLLGDAAGVNFHWAISDTAVTSAAVPVMKHSEKPDELLRHDAALDHFDIVPPRQLDHGRRVMPARKQSAIGVWILPSLMKKMLAPVHSATRPCQSSIMASA